LVLSFVASFFKLTTFCSQTARVLVPSTSEEELELPVHVSVGMGKRKKVSGSNKQKEFLGVIDLTVDDN
jgi:hypothetical protein